ncbi:MAG: hypothetical protein ABSC63_16710 [Candidatus Binataceae bacterium]
MREQIGEAADRRHTAPLASVTLWALLCGAAVVAVHTVTGALPGRLGSYRSGIITILSFTLAALYSVRKHTLWLSVRWLRLATRMPRSIARRLILMDRLQTWRTMHITIGVMVLLPFWWHVDAGRATLLERALESTVILVVLSGLFGAAIHDLLPHSMRIRPNPEVRFEDVEAGYRQLYLEAEESVLGHSEELVHTYLNNVRPLLVGSQPWTRLAWATLSGTDPAPRACAAARLAEAATGGDGSLYGELVGIAERKVRLEHNEFNLRLSRSWLKVHLALVMIMLCEIAFHVTGVLYFVGF